MRKPNLIWIVVAVQLGCGGSRPTAPSSSVDYPGTLVSTDRITGNFMWVQRVTASHPDGEVSFRAVVEKHGNVLTMVGFAPFGARAFVLTQEGMRVNFRRELDFRLPFPPKFMLLDLHRTFFMGAGSPPLSNGTRRAALHDEIVFERWQNGKLVEKRFSRRQGAPHGEIRVQYVGGLIGHSPPRTVIFENGWFGYTLRIETLQTAP